MLQSIRQECFRDTPPHNITLEMIYEYALLCTYSSDCRYKEYVNFIYVLTNVCWNFRIPEVINDVEFIKRCYTRVCLLKHGWSDESIEAFIQSTFRIQVSQHDILRQNVYLFSRKLLRLPLDTGKKQKGRPAIPNELKGLCKQSYTRKNKEKMKGMYEIYKMLTKDILGKAIHLAESSRDAEGELEEIFREILRLKYP